MKTYQSAQKAIIATFRSKALIVVVGALTLVGAQLSLLLVPKFTGMAIDSVRSFGNLVEARVPDAFSTFAQNLVGSTNDHEGFDSRLLWAIAIGALVAGVLQFFKRWCITGISRHVEYDLRRNLFARLTMLPMSFFSSTRSGDIMTRATSDVEATRMMTGPAVMYLGESMVLMPLGLTAMYLISPTLMLWALVPLALLTASTLFFSPRQRKHSLAVQERQSDLAARGQENFSGVRVVKAFTREGFEAQQFDDLGRSLLKSQIALARDRIAFQATIWTLNGTGMLIFLWFGAKAIAAKELSLGQFLELNFYFMILYWPMIAMGWVVMLLIRGRVSARRMNEVLSLDADPAVSSAGLAPKALQGRITFRNVSFAYNTGPEVLHDISFDIEPGRSLAVVGPVGCGKSTLARLLLRLEEPSSGEVLVDGRPVADYQPSVLRRHIGFVPQETFLFSDTIRANIAFGVNEASDSEVQSAATTAQLAEEIKPLPKGFDTTLGERGVNLSGGQKQRAAIARALIKRPAMMVLDDCLSAVDTHTEDAILSGLKRELAGVTTLIIAQRVSTVAHADEILVMDEGRIVERGTDASLREAGGLYARMAENQSLVSALAAEDA